MLGESNTSAVFWYLAFPLTAISFYDVKEVIIPLPIGGPTSSGQKLLHLLLYQLELQNSIPKVPYYSLHKISLANSPQASSRASSRRNRRTRKWPLPPQPPCRNGAQAKPSSHGRSVTRRRENGDDTFDI